nr:Flp family type IVb pilin [uncultured Roseateles sp.]
MDTHRHPIPDAESALAANAAQALRDERAATAIEYGLIAALIAVAILGALTLTGSSLTALYQYWSSAVVAAL